MSKRPTRLTDDLLTEILSSGFPTEDEVKTETDLSSFLIEVAFYHN